MKMVCFKIQLDNKKGLKSKVNTNFKVSLSSSLLENISLHWGLPSLPFVHIWIDAGFEWLCYKNSQTQTAWCKRTGNIIIQKRTEN